MLEPLTTLAWRTQVEQRMVTLTEQNPEWFRTYFSGLIGTIIGSLPSEDPWRNPGVQFGSTQDALDLAVSLVEPEELNVDLAPLAGSLDATERGYYRACSVSTDAGREFLRGTFSYGGWEFYEVCRHVLAWALTRRRAYRGVNDAWVIVQMDDWVSRTNDIMESGTSSPLLETWDEPTWMKGRIEDGTYVMLSDGD